VKTKKIELEMVRKC